MEETISVSEFKAKCLGIFQRLADHRLAKVTVTRRGRPVAVLTPPETDEAQARAVHGSMAGMAVVSPGVDLTKPVFEGVMDAELGGDLDDALGVLPQREWFDKDYYRSGGVASGSWGDPRSFRLTVSTEL